VKPEIYFSFSRDKIAELHLAAGTAIRKAKIIENRSRVEIATRAGMKLRRRSTVRRRTFRRDRD